MLLFLNFSYSQQYKFSGVILDEKGNSVPYVNLLDSISLLGTSADYDGNFELLLVKSQKLE